jgi:hypothetical protein
MVSYWNVSINVSYPNWKCMSYADIYKGHGTAPALATQQLAGHYGHSNGLKII